MTPDEITKFGIQLITILASSSVVSAIVVGYFERRKKSAESADIITDSARKLLDEQHKRIEDLRNDLTAAEAKLDDTVSRLNLATQKAMTLETELIQMQNKVVELREEKKFNTLLQLIHDPIFIIQADTGNIVHFNDAANTVYGWGHNELSKMNIAELSAEQDKMETAISQHLTYIPIQRHLKRDGTIIAVSIHMGYFTDSNERFIIQIVNKRDNDDPHTQDLHMQEYLNEARMTTEADWIILWKLERGYKGTLRISPIFELNRPGLPDLSTFYDKQDVTETKRLFGSSQTVYRITSQDDNEIGRELKRQNAKIAYIVLIKDIDQTTKGILMLVYKSDTALQPLLQSELPLLASRCIKYIQDHV